MAVDLYVKNHQIDWSTFRMNVWHPKVIHFNIATCPMLSHSNFTNFVRSSSVGSRLCPTTRSISLWHFFKISGCRQNLCNKNCICVASATNVANNRSTIVRTSCLSVKWKKKSKRIISSFSHVAIQFRTQFN